MGRKKDSIWMLPGYMDGINEAGGLPIIFPFSADRQEIDQLFGMCDGILMTGGHDVSAELYHEAPLEGIVEYCEQRDEMEAVYLPGKKFVWAVQWHPEFSYKSDVNSKKILRAFVEAAGF